MPTTKIPQFSFGGVSSRDNPANAPLTRSARCRNFVPQANGALKLRLGYTQPTMSTTTATTIHSAAYFELYAGTQYIIFGQGTDLKRYAVSGGTVTTLGTLSNSNAWSYFRAANKIHIGNGTDFKTYDGTTLRDSGIRAPNSTETSAVSCTSSTATAGSFSTTTLSGYQMYLVYYNPTTGHVGNRASVGSRVTVAAAGYSIVVTGLPDLSTVDTEWVKVLGRTTDGGEVPYWCTDASGTLITIGNTASTATITQTTVDYNSELPSRNTVGSGFDKFAKVGGRIFAAKPNDINIYYSEAEEDAVNGDFVGRPEESWPANNAEAFPPAEVPTAIHGWKMRGWFFSRNYLAIWNESLRQQLVDPWEGLWLGGCAGQRAFTWTPYGPFWVSYDKQLLTWGGSAPVPASEEYEQGLLAQISDANLQYTEVTYFRDPAQKIDQLKVLGRDSSGDPVVVIHDFTLRDERSPLGQGYDQVYVGTVPYIMVGAGYTPFTPVLDSNKKMRSWSASTTGRFQQLDDGLTDNGSVYTGDYVTLPIHLGFNEPRIAAIGLLGDSTGQVSYAMGLDDLLDEFEATQQQIRDEDSYLYEANISDQGAYLRLRLQLASHSADGDFDLNDAQAPVNDYGILYGVKLLTGAGIYEGR